MSKKQKKLLEPHKPRTETPALSDAYKALISAFVRSHIRKNKK